LTTSAEVRDEAPAAGTHGVGRIPDFFVVGHAKSGTTALYSMLKSHPEIFMPNGKEPWYFATELHERPPPRPEGIAGTLEEYGALFAGAAPEQRVGEASALYLWSHTAAARIAAAQPEAQIIAILREPASFLRSLHSQFVQVYVEPETDFRTALALEPQRREGHQIPRYTYLPQALLYSEHVHYVEQLRRYRDLFGAQRMKVLIYEDFRRDNEAAVRQVLRFLEVDDTLPIRVTEANPTVRVRSQRLHHLVHALSVGRGPLSRTAKASLKAVFPARLRRGALRATQRHVLYTEPAIPDQELTNELRRRFKGEVEALSEYLDRDLVSLWGYEDVA
jgi:Sulfotransferase domain